MFDMMISRSYLNIGYVRLDSRSLDSISLKPCLHSRGHIFALNFMKLNQTVSLDNILFKFEYGSCRIKI